VELYQYNEIEISKQYLLTTGFYLLWRNEDFEMDNRVIALFDIANYEVEGVKTLVLHLDYGVIIEERSTRQLMNELHKANGFGFIFSKVSAGLFGLKCYIPFVHAYQTYMPINGGSRKNTDWISPNLLAKAHVADGLLHLVAVNGNEVRLSFNKGDFDKRLHDVSLLSRANFLFLEAIVNWGNCELKAPDELGLLAAFENCKCLEHEQMELRVTNLQSMVKDFKMAILNNLGIDKFQKVESIKYYSQNLSRFKKIY